MSVNAAIQKLISLVPTSPRLKPRIRYLVQCALTVSRQSDWLIKGPVDGCSIMDAQVAANGSEYVTHFGKVEDHVSVTNCYTLSRMNYR